MADEFAARGYLVVIPDLFNHDAISVDAFYGTGEKVVLQDWLVNHQPATVDPIAETIIKYLRTTLKVKNVAGVGYCYGAKVGGSFLREIYMYTRIIDS
jgi:dienelactone hydrolase